MYIKLEKSTFILQVIKSDILKKYYREKSINKGDGV